MTFWIALAGAVLGAASMILHVVAPKTATKWDDRAADLVDKAREKLS
jgi:hypothetical protein